MVLMGRGKGKNGIAFQAFVCFLSLERANHRASVVGYCAWCLEFFLGKRAFRPFSWVDIWGIRYLHFSNDHDFEMALTLLIFLSVLWLSSPDTGSP